jgi:hypothetical protein
VNSRGAAAMTSSEARQMNGNDAQTLRDLRFFTDRLLDHAELLPQELAAMLLEYASELGKASPGRWDGMGNHAQYGSLAQYISQSIADGQWPAGARLDCSPDIWYFRPQPHENVEGALRLLAVQGEIDLRDGKYYVRSRDDSS